MKKANIYRTHSCGELTKSDANKSVTLAGWMHSRRDHGGIIFIDIRDRFGLTQLRFDPDNSEDVFKIADKLRAEDVFTVTGKVIKRPSGMQNKKLATGEIEVDVMELTLLNKSKTPPFEIDREPENLDEDVRLKYRYLDLRHKRMQKNIEFRSDVMSSIRTFFRKNKFIEIETPVMGRETPEGARDYLVPSRVYPGEVYALAQAPQQYKQLLMVAGLDRYFQLSKSFRDEDPRADRFPEFTQVDMEMSYVEQEDVLNIMEELIISLAKEYSQAKVVGEPIVRLKYADVMERYGLDKPDIRFGLELNDVTSIVHKSNFAVFAKAESVQALAAPIASYSRKEFDDLISKAQDLGAKGLAWISLKGASGFESPIAKFFSDDQLKELAKTVGAKKGDAILFVADKKESALDVLGRLRNHIGDLLELRDPKKLAFAWIYDFPMFEFNQEEQRIEPMHHMFTQPYPEDLDKLEKEPLSVKAQLYDLVLNGFELGSGSVRIWQPELQRLVMSMIGISKEEQDKKFGHMLKAFEYGAPPHAGMALGFDRLVALLRGENNMRDLIAFPMNSQARDLMTGAPSPITPAQLKELGLSLRKPLKK